MELPLVVVNHAEKIVWKYFFDSIVKSFVIKNLLKTDNIR